MKHKLFGELAVAVALILILCGFLSSASLRMPMSIQNLLVIGLILLFLGFAGLVWRERVHDEREEMHRERAGRFSFLGGVALLVFGVVYQSFQYHIDPWLIYTLVGMIALKTILRFYFELKS